MSQSESRFVVVPEGTRWPSGDYYDLAHLPIDEDTLTSVLGSPLVRGVEDGLGPWAAIGIRLSSGTALEFIRYQYEPTPPGFSVCADMKADLSRALDDVLEIFSLKRSSLVWVSPRVAPD